MGVLGCQSSSRAGRVPEESLVKRAVAVGTKRKDFVQVGPLQTPQEGGVSKRQEKLWQGF